MPYATGCWWFAIAGVSMRPPANLLGFPELARQVAQGTGLSIGECQAETGSWDSSRKWNQASIASGWTTSKIHPKKQNSSHGLADHTDRFRKLDGRFRPCLESESSSGIFSDSRATLLT